MAYFQNHPHYYFVGIKNILDVDIVSNTIFLTDKEYEHRYLISAQEIEEEKFKMVLDYVSKSLGANIK